MANDDHFETVHVAYEGIQNELLSDEGILIWDENRPDEIGRSPFYVLSLYAMMKVQESVGIFSLDSMMYLIRLLHALLSLLLVFYGYKYVYAATGSKHYSMLAGLILAGHFLMPYLAVRNLIEMVSADLLVPAIYFAYLGTKEDSVRKLLVSGILCGLAWMIRFDICLAVLPIPFAIWYLKKSSRQAVWFSLGVLLMLLFSANLDWIFMGDFGQSTINILRGYFSGSPTMPQPFLMYVPLVFGILIPPFSFYFLISAFRKKVTSEHLILVSAIIFFFITHSLIPNKQERFMIPIFPLLIVVGVIGLFHWLESNRISRVRKKIFRYSSVFAIALNLILLPVFTLNYAHKGMVEPFVYLSEQADVDAVLVDRTERHRFMTTDYAGYEQPDFIALDKWSELGEIQNESSLYDRVNYFIIYTDREPVGHVDSLTKAFGPLKQVFHSTPSTVDILLHFLNPKHNHTNEAWVYRRQERATAYDAEL